MKPTRTIRGHELAPVDSVADRVTRPGVEYVPSKKLAQDCWDVKPPTLPAPSNAKEMMGLRRGRLVIVGYLGKKKWLARCDCGKFERRDGKNFRNGVRDGIWDGCQYCQHAAYLRRHDEYRQHGANRDETFR